MVTKASPEPANVFKVASSKSPVAVNPILDSVLSTLLLTLTALPL